LGAKAIGSCSGASKKGVVRYLCVRRSKSVRREYLNEKGGLRISTTKEEEGRGGREKVLGGAHDMSNSDH